MIFLDIETNLKHDKIWMCVTKKEGDVKVWRSAEGLQHYLKYEDVWAHNGIGFDFPLLSKLWNVNIPVEQQKDTLILSRLYNPELQAPEQDPKAGNHSLKAWGIRLGNYKEESTDFDAGWTQQMEDYCIQDVMVLESLYSFLMSELMSMGFSQQSIDLEHKVAHICKRMEDNGYTLDIQKAQTLLATLSGRMADIENSLQEVFPPTFEQTKTPEYWEVVDEKWREHRAETKTALLEALKAAGVDKPNKLIKEAIAGPVKVKVHPFNPGSRQQIAERLQSLGVELTERTEKGQLIVNEDVLAAIDKPEAKLLNEYLMVQKRVALISSWLDEVKDDGKVHGRIITCGAVTGRATHRSPNMAQIPNTSSPYGKECREMWNAGKGRMQVGVDLSGIELRCLAHYLRDAGWQEELLKGDVHWMNAQSFGLVPKGTAKDTANAEHVKARNLSKGLVYATSYGAGPAKIALMANVTERRAKQMIEAFITSTPGLEQLKKKLSKFVKVGHLPGLDGRRVRVRSEHAALNTLLQSAGAIIAKQWLCEADEMIRQEALDAHLMAWVHDEVQFSVIPEHAERAAKLIEEAARRAGIALNFRCPVDAEGKIGKNWYDCH